MRIVLTMVKKMHNFKREGETSGHADTLGRVDGRHNPGVTLRLPK